MVDIPTLERSSKFIPFRDMSRCTASAFPLFKSCWQSSSSWTISWYPLSASAKMGSARIELALLYSGYVRKETVATTVTGSKRSFKIAAPESAANILNLFSPKPDWFRECFSPTYRSSQLVIFTIRWIYFLSVHGTVRLLNEEKSFELLMCRLKFHYVFFWSSFQERIVPRSLIC